MCEKLSYGRNIRLSQRLVTMYHASVTGAEEFPKPDSQLRCVVATIAFGMGVDVPHVRRVVHWGPAKTELNFWQEIGRCFRDGERGQADLYLLGPVMTRRETNTEMLEICREVESGACLRCKVLECLVLQDMNVSVLDKLKSRISKSSSCEAHCQCDYGLCCHKCKESGEHE